MKILNKNGLNRLVTDTRQYVDGKTRVLTQAEYDALSEAEKNNGTIYFVPDAAGSDVTASEVTFDNTGTSMTATNVQAAITELEAGGGGGGVGKDLSGQTVKPTSSTEVTAGEGAEIFNDYRNRTYDSEGKVTQGNIASGPYSHAEGECTTASAEHSHAEGTLTTASQRESHAEGYFTTASGISSHAEGHSTTASGISSHAEGHTTQASGRMSHAEGHMTQASGYSSHAEGYTTEARGDYSHAEGYITQAKGETSHAEGSGTIAQRKSQHVFGEFNILDTAGTNTKTKGSYVEIVGNGTDTSARSNARTLDWDGNEVLTGSLTTTDVVRNAKWDGTNTSLATAISSLNSTLSNYIKLRKFKIYNSNLTTNKDLSSFVKIDAGYKFLCYQILGSADGWVPTFPIYISNPQYTVGYPWWSGTLASGGSVWFYYFEIKDV